MKSLKNSLSLLGLTAALMVPASGAIALVDTEATVRDGTQADTDQDEATAGYVMVKFSSTGSARQAFFQFDLTGQNADLSQAADFSMFLQSARSQEIQVWALDQAYTGFTSGITWNNAQANDTSNNEMLTVGAFTATKIGGTIAVPGTSIGDEVIANLASLTPFVFDDKITFAVTGIDNVSNNSGGLRIERGASELEFAQVPEPSSFALLGLAGFGSMLRRKR
jgi:hypothetical protein